MSDVFSSLERIDSYVEYRKESDFGLPDVLDITEACQLCGWALNGSLLDITQLLHNDPTVLLILQHTRWLTMKVMARQIWTACVRKKSEKHTAL